jgi:hypothetical protein
MSILMNFQKATHSVGICGVTGHRDPAAVAAGADHLLPDVADERPARGQRRPEGAAAARAHRGAPQNVPDGGAQGGRGRRRRAAHALAQNPARPAQADGQQPVRGRRGRRSRSASSQPQQPSQRTPKTNSRLEQNCGENCLFWRG